MGFLIKRIYKGLLIINLWDFWLERCGISDHGDDPSGRNVHLVFLVNEPQFQPLGNIMVIIGTAICYYIVYLTIVYLLHASTSCSANVMVIDKVGSTSCSTARRCLRDSRGLVAPPRRHPAPEKHTLAEPAWRLVQVHLERSHISRVILALGQVSAPGKICQMASLSHLSAKLKTRMEKYPSRFVDKLGMLVEMSKM